MADIPPDSRPTRSLSVGSEPPSAFTGSCIPVSVENPVTMTEQRRVRPQAPLFDGDGHLRRLLYSTDGSGKVTIATALADTDDGGYSWTDGRSNPVLDRIESDWQHRRAFVTALAWDGRRWVMATVGDDTTHATPGIRATGLWFSEDLLDWREYPENPIITVETDGAAGNTSLFPSGDPPVGMYLRDFQRVDGDWHALVQWRGDGTWSRMTVMRSDGDITGPWRFQELCLDPDDASPWFGHNDTINWCQPTRIDGRWYAVCQNGVSPEDENNAHVGIVYSEDYRNWREFDNPVTQKLARPDGSRVVPSQQFLLPPEGGRPWRILLGARGLDGGDPYMYLLEATAE